MEMNRLPPNTPGTTGGMKSPMTPRTLAFNVLDGNVDGDGNSAAGIKNARRVSHRELPLRHHIAMGDETWKGPDAR